MRHALLLLCAFGAAVARGQDAPALPDTLAWERVGDFEADGLFVEADTVWAIEGTNYLYRLVPGSDWSRSERRLPPIVNDLWIAPEGVMYVQGGKLRRSADRGLTWAEVLPDAFSLPFLTLAGSLLAANRERGGTVARSTDAGLTWALLDHDDGLGCTPLDFAATPPTPGLPEGRIAVVGFCGFSYSDDDGRTWMQTALYENFRYYVPSVVRLSAGPHAGRLIAEVEDGARIGGSGLVYGSDDGGATWRDLGPISRVRTERLFDVEVDATGRLWAATRGPVGQVEGGGVWQTVEPVVEVAAEAPPEVATASLLLEAPYPNPAAGTVTVPLALAEAAAVRVAVYDVLGREVAVLHDGPYAAGRHALVLDAAGLVPGVYVVRAETNSTAPTRRMTVLR